MQTYVTLQPLLHSHSTSHRTASFISTLCNTSSFTFILCPEVMKDSQFLHNVAECKNLSRGPENGKLWGGSLVAWVERWVDDWLGGTTLLLFTVTASHIHTLWVTGSFKTGANVQKLLCLQACFCNGESSGWDEEALQIPRPEISPCLLASVNLFVCSVLTFQLLVICKAGEA